MSRCHLPCKGYVLSWMALLLQVPGLGRKRGLSRISRILSSQCSQAGEVIRAAVRRLASPRQWGHKSREGPKRPWLPKVGL